MDTVQLIAKSFVTEYKAKTPAKLKVRVCEGGEADVPMRKGNPNKNTAHCSGHTPVSHGSAWAAGWSPHLD